MNRSALGVLGCYIIWGLLPVFWHLLGGVNSFYTLACRIFFTFACAFAAAVIKGGLGEMRAVFRDWKTLRVFICTSFFILINWGVYIWCVAHEMLLDASLAYYINPILSICIGALVFREKLTRLQWLSVALAGVGVAYPMIAAGEFPVFAALMALSFALYGAFKKNVTVSGNTGTMTETALLAPFALILIVVLERNGTGAIASAALTGWEWLLLPLSGLVTWLPLTLFSRGIKKTPLSLSGILMFINPTLQMIVGLVLFRETLTDAMKVTYLFVWAAVIIYILAGSAAAKKNKEEAEKVEVNT